jgi:hypothetical protein
MRSRRCARPQRATLAQTPERDAALILDFGPVDADIAQAAVIQARKQLPIAAALAPCADRCHAPDHQACRAGSQTADTAGGLRVRRLGPAHAGGAFHAWLSIACGWLPAARPRRLRVMLGATLWPRKYPAGIGLARVDGRAGIGLNFASSGAIFRIDTRGRP